MIQYVLRLIHAEEGKAQLTPNIWLQRTWRRAIGCSNALDPRRAALSNLIYRIKKPYPFRFGTNRTELTRTCLDLFTYQDFLGLHHMIRREGHLTLDGKYDDSEWEGFAQAARNEGGGTESVRRSGNWERAKQQYGSPLRSILGEYFFRHDVGRRGWLIVCITLSTLGYILLSIPSVDLFVKVLISTVGVGTVGEA